MGINMTTRYFRLFSLAGIFILVCCLICCENDLSNNTCVNYSTSTIVNYTKYDAIELGIKINAPTPQIERYFNDLIHPCVRFIPEGFAGHKWWLVASPYIGFNRFLENPILYFGDSTDDSLPPINWIAVGVIEDTPKTGYNSDPNIFFNGEGLWIFWRENYTPDCITQKISRGTFGKYSLDGTTFKGKRLFATELTDSIDSEMCPIVFSIDGQIKLFGCHHKFPQKRRIPLGLTIWDLPDNDFDNAFVKTIDVMPSYKKGFDFWHFDIFAYEDKYYCVASNEKGNEILLGQSNDGINYRFWDTPLLSSTGTRGRSYFYKPSAMVYNGMFYLWYPIAELGITPQTNRIWMSQINFEKLIQFLNIKKLITENIQQNEDINFYNTTDGVEIINNYQSTKLKIVSTTGKMVYNALINIGNTLIKLNKGFYIISTKYSNTKIIIL